MNLAVQRQSGGAWGPATKVHHKRWTQKSALIRRAMLRSLAATDLQTLLQLQPQQSIRGAAASDRAGTLVIRRQSGRDAALCVMTASAHPHARHSSSPA